MSEEPKLTLAKPEDLAWALSFALRFNGRKRWHGADDMMGRIAAEHIMRHLDQSGFVVMRKPPAAAPRAPDSYQLPRLKD